MMRRIGLFGGTFDPVHKAHIRLAVTCREKLGLDEVWLMVSPQNPWKSGSQMTPDHHRLMMARLAVEEEDGIVASDYELNLPTPSYTYKTLRSLRHDFPSDTFVLLVGGDNWRLSTNGLNTVRYSHIIPSPCIPGRGALLSLPTRSETWP